MEVSSQCSHCQTSVQPGTKFCGFCGTPQVAGAVAAGPLPAWKAKFVEGYFRGQVKSKGGKVWTYENGLLRGPTPSMQYAWLGDVLRRSEGGDAVHGHGNYDGRTLSWSFGDMKETFYEYEMPNDTTFHCTKMAFGPTKWNWTLNGIKLSTSDTPLEGTEDEWEVTGDVPPPVALFVVCFEKVQLLHAKWKERSQRVYARCGKLVLAAGKQPRLCASCASAGDVCMVCSAPNPQHDGNMCKNCAPKIGLCGKCSEPLKGSKVPGKLCLKCGLGSNQMNCARMVFGRNI